MYDVRLLDAATSDLQSIDRVVAQRIARRIQWLAENLESVRPIPLAGELSGLFKLRVGDYRVVYELLHAETAVVIHAIGHRRDIYR